MSGNVLFAICMHFCMHVPNAHSGDIDTSAEITQWDDGLSIAKKTTSAAGAGTDSGMID